MVDAAQIVSLQEQMTLLWHQDPAAEAVVPDAENAAWLSRVALQHRANFDLWHIEDEARAPHATDHDLAQVKRRIDRTNQQRNDLAEKLDLALLEWLDAHAPMDPAAPLHSETPGLMIDRLSILALKTFHTREEAERVDAPASHLQRNRLRLGILTEQRGDLANCLDELWRQALVGERRFKLYRQLKMYNDPALNPAIYRAAGK
jgi:hypothetical protein